MTKLWNKWSSRGDSRDCLWQYREDEIDYCWLKKTIAAVCIFAIFYGLHITESSLGRAVDDGVHYILTTETDWNYAAEQVIKYTPRNIDSSVLKKVQTAMSKPADPLMYMNKPVNGKILSPFGWRTHPVLKQEMMHDGIDIEAAVGTNVRVTAAGQVKAVTDSAHYGKTLIVEHSKDIETVYGHLSEVLVKEGDTVSQGQVVARTGKSGITNTPMLYFEIRENGKPIDPMTRLKGEFPAEEGK